MVVLEKISNLFSQALLWIAGLFLVAMISITGANIVIRLFWLPIRGTFELMGYFGAIVTAFALGYTQIKRGHIAVDIVVLRFSKKTQKILTAVNHLICMFFFVIVTWQVFKHATTLRETGEVTETLQIVYYPFTYAVALGCLILAVTFFVGFLKSIFGDQGSSQ
ncbi:TRAP transporter small permease [Thermodesulfobacteriota bacterium]